MVSSVVRAQARPTPEGSSGGTDPLPDNLELLLGCRTERALYSTCEEGQPRENRLGHPVVVGRSVSTEGGRADARQVSEVILIFRRPQAQAHPSLQPPTHLPISLHHGRLYSR